MDAARGTVPSTKARSRQRRGWVMILAPKGGMGKTTSATNLAVAAARDGRKVLAVDFDAQKSLTTWAKKRWRRSDRDELAQIQVFEGDLRDRDAAFHMAEDFDFVVFDTPPGAEGDMGAKLLSLATRCDVVAIPVSTSTADNEKVRQFGRDVLARNHISYFFFFARVSRVHDTKRDIEAAKKGLQGYGPVLEPTIALRTEVKRMMETGICSADAPGMHGHDEFQQLYSLVREKVAA